MKNIILLGATGSIGTQTIEVLRDLSNQYRLVSFSFGKNLSKAISIINEFKPRYVCSELKEHADILKNIFPYLQVGYGSEGLLECATFDVGDHYPTTVVNALVGSLGLKPTVAAIRKGYTIALANKETLVTAGKIVTEEVRKHQVTLVPIDSEHSAIFQCLHGENHKNIKRIILTASGGAFRDKTRDQLEDVTVEEALRHPNWSMGSKITIDSATMMNKGFEVIEAHFLFNVDYDSIATVLHRESIIHSLVEFHDTAILAQLGTPDMKVPIAYALTYPDRIMISNVKPLDLTEVGTLHFEKVDFTRFPCLKYAYDAGIIGHSLPTVLNAANEAAVKLFLEGKIKFLDIEKIIYENLEQHKLIKDPDLETIIQLDKELKERIISSAERRAL